MQLVQLDENTWVIQGGANIGVIAHEGAKLLPWKFQGRYSHGGDCQT